MSKTFFKESGTIAVFVGNSTATNGLTVPGDWKSSTGYGMPGTVTTSVIGGRVGAIGGGSSWAGNSTGSSGGCSSGSDSYDPYPTWHEDYDRIKRQYSKLSEVHKKEVVIKKGQVGKVCPVTGEVQVINVENGECKKMSCRNTVYEYKLKVVNLAHGVKDRVLLSVTGVIELNPDRSLHDIVLVKHAKELSAFSKDAEHLSIKVSITDTHTVECKEKE